MCVEVDDILTPAYPGVAWKTRLWASGTTLEAIEIYTARKDRPRGFFVGKLKYYAETGFDPWIGKDRPIRHEWDGVYRIGHPSTLFRVYGFFENNTTRNFIALDAFVKRGRKLNAREIARVNCVVDLRVRGAWRYRKEEANEQTQDPK